MGKEQVKQGLQQELPNCKIPLQSQEHVFFQYSPGCACMRFIIWFGTLARISVGSGRGPSGKKDIGIRL